MGKKISKYISYKEAIKSNTAIKFGIDNTPNRDELKKMRKVAKSIFEPVRTYFNVPIAITSFFRSGKLNKKIGGSKTSQHRTGEAMDLDADVYNNISNKQIFKYIRDNLIFDQLISEYPDKNGNPSWVHVSYDYKGNNRREILVAYKNKFNKTKYKYYEG